MATEGKKGRRDSTAFVPLRGAEAERLGQDERREINWKRWGPYLSERQWATVREDYSPDGSCWDYFPHDHARSRTYRWGEDGLLGICDREGRLCFALALWNGRDPILKERLFGLTGPEGNHGEDVKEIYFYLDSTPTHSYMKALYKYPQREFPYGGLVAENARRTKEDPEYEIQETGAFEDGRYFDVFAEYAKAAADDVRIRITVANRGPEAAHIEVLPTLWFRNTWSWGRSGEGYWKKPSLSADGDLAVIAEHESLGKFRLDASADRAPLSLLFTENETNTDRLFGVPSQSPFVKDAFHAAVVGGRGDAVHPGRTGTKAALRYALTIPPGGEVSLRLRLSSGTPAGIGDDFDAVFADRIREADAFWKSRIPAALTGEERNVARQAYAGLLWTKQFYHFAVRDWLEG
ncbi:MAG: glucosidase, partial [Acidobacteriota bacterium]